MKKLLFIALMACGLEIPAQAEPEVTAADLAQHLGIHFWKFAKEDLPANYSVAIVEIKDGKVADGYLPAFRPPEPGDLVIGANRESDGGVNVTVSIGGASMGLGSLPRKKIGISGIRPFKELKPNEPAVLAGDYRVIDGKETISGKVEDTVSGIALLLLVDEK